MSRSRKHFPAGKNDLGSQKPGKKICHRLFRQRESMALRTGFLHDLPYRMWQIIDPWDLHDGRAYYGRMKGEWYARMMRK